MYLTLKQPFYPASRRLKFYLLGSFIFSAVIVTILGVYSALDKGLTAICEPFSSKTDASLYNSIIAVSLSLYIVIALFSIVYTGRMLSKPGISPNIKQLFMKKHILYVV